MADEPVSFPLVSPAGYRLGWRRPRGGYRALDRPGVLKIPCPRGPKPDQAERVKRANAPSGFGA